MRPAHRDITVYRGDDYRHAVAFVNADDTPKDLTGYTYTAQLRSRPDETLLVAMTCTAGDTTGIIYITIAHSLTENLIPGRRVWDFQETSLAGIITTKLAGTVEVAADVTHSDPVLVTTRIAA